MLIFFESIGFNCETPVIADTAITNNVGAAGAGICKCLNGGSCVSNSTHCYCPAGYTGEYCEKVETCSIENCKEPMVCQQNKCICPENKICTSCSVQPCRNGGICTDLPNDDYECKCPDGWTGRNCQKDTDECQIRKICGNGICRNEEGTYKCYCTPGFTGIHCDSEVDECLSSPCKNGATCHNKVCKFIIRKTKLNQRSSESFNIENKRLKRRT